MDLRDAPIDMRRVLDLGLCFADEFECTIAVLADGLELTDDQLQSGADLDPSLLVVLRQLLRRRDPHRLVIKTFIERGLQRHRFGALDADAALGRVDDPRSRVAREVFLEVALKLRDVGGHLFVGKYLTPVHIFLDAQQTLHPRDAFPLEHFKRPVLGEFPAPDRMDRRAARVVLPVGESEVLTDQDRVGASEVFGEVVVQVRDGRAGTKLSHRARKFFTEQQVKLLLRSAQYFTRERVKYRGVRFGFHNQSHTIDIFLGQTLVEPLADLVVIECRHKVGLDPTLKQWLEHRLHRDDHHTLAHARVFKQVQVPRQTRSRGNQHRGAPSARITERFNPGARGVVLEIHQDVAECVSSMRQHRHQVRARRADNIEQGPRKLVCGPFEPFLAWGMRRELNTRRNKRFGLIEQLS